MVNVIYWLLLLGSRRPVASDKIVFLPQLHAAIHRQHSYNVTRTMGEGKKRGGMGGGGGMVNVIYWLLLLGSRRPVASDKIVFLPQLHAAIHRQHSYNVTRTVGEGWRQGD